MPYYPHAYSSSAYMPSPGYGYSPYDTGYPLPVHMPMEPYYPPSTTYYPTSPYYVSLFIHHSIFPSDIYIRAMDIGTTAIRATLMAIHEYL